MKTGPPSVTDINARTRRFIKILFLVIAAVGSLGFYFFQWTALGGAGLSGSLFALVSFFHFNKPRKGKTQYIDTKMTWFLLGMTLLGVVIMIVNHMQDGPDFYRGVSAGMSMICGVTYGMELMMTWLDNVR